MSHENVHNQDAGLARPRSQAPARLRVALLAIVALLLCDGRAAAELTILGADSDLGREIDAAEKLIRDGRRQRGLTQLQQLHETSHGRNRVLLGRGKPKVYESSVRVVIRLLKDLAQEPEFLEHYRTEYDLVASSLYQRSVSQPGDGRPNPEQLLRTYELYPLSSVAFDAALRAGDLFFERAEPLRAREAWAWITEDDLSPERRQMMARRWVLLASQTGDVKLHQHWWEQLEGLPVAGTEGTTSEVDTLPPAPKKAPDPFDALPELPFLEGEVSGLSAGMFSRERRFMDDPRHNHYTQIPTPVDSLVAVTTLKKLRFFDPRLGMKNVREVQFDRIRRKRVDGDRTNRSFEYLEYDKNLRLEPAVAQGIVVTSYVYEANQRQEYVGYLIRESIPYRSLFAYHVKKRQKLWTSRASKDKIVRDLSFRSKPLIHEGKVYALGWRWAGLIDSFLCCFDLKTGELHWKTAVVGNQVDLTMFGEINSEPFLGDVVTAGGKVFVQTNLGAVAAIRAWDGHTLWVTPYQAIVVPAARQRQNKVLRPQNFKPSPPVLYEDRLIVAPLDSKFSLAFHMETGQILMRRSASRGEMLVGQYGDYVIFCNRRHAVRVPARDIAGASQSFPLSGDVYAMPALTKQGMVYSCEAGLFLDRFRGDQDSHLIVDTPQQRGRRRSPRQDGNVTILDDSIVVTNSYHIQSFKKSRHIPVQPR